MTIPDGPKVFRHMPAPYRRAGRGGPDSEQTVLGLLTDGLQNALRVLDQHAKQLIFGAYLDQAPDLEDAQALAALYELAPWPDETLPDFQFRVAQMARICLAGPASATTLLQVVGLALGAAVEGSVHLPGEAGNDAQTTTALLQRQGDPTRVYSAAVIDAPPVLARQTETLSGRSAWTIRNNLFRKFPYAAADGTDHPAVYPDPIIDITAVGADLTVPILFQRDLGRLILINRVIPAGATLRLDLSGASPAVTSVTGPACLPGPVRVDGGSPALVYGAGEQLGRGVTGGLRLVTWSEQTTASGLPLPAPVPGGPIPWSSLLGVGDSHWQLLTGCTQAGAAPAAAELPLPSLRPLPLAAARTATVSFYWYGRQPGTFTVQYGDALTGEPPADVGPRRHAWLEAQLQRLKQAGLVYLPPEQLAVRRLWLRDEAQASDSLAARGISFGRFSDIADAADAFSITVKGV